MSAAESVIRSAISPKSSSGSFAWAIVAHATLFGGILAVLNSGFFKPPRPISVAEEIAYETFSVPPAPAEIARPVARTPEPEVPQQPQSHVDTAPHEMQDTQSTIAGTQATAKVPSSTGAQGVGDARATPYYKIKPKYPRAALSAGVEGWILLKIDVNEKGEVENVRIVGGQERGMFQDEARRAVEKWKYKPFLDASGKPARKADHEVRVDFKLQDAA